jgi:hypothetical protein
VAALAGLTTDSLEVRVVTTTAGGAAGPTATRVIRYDNVAPEAPFTIARPTGFVGTGFTFATTATGAGTALGVTPADVMPGSGNVTVTFHVVPVTTANNALTAAQIVAQGTQVTGADQLEETAAGYRLVARARDAVGNVRLSNIIEGLRVDRTAPSIVTVGLAQNQIFNTPIAAGTTFSVNVQDDESGFNAAAALRVTATRLSAAGTQCFNAATGALTAQPCSAVTTGLSLMLPSGTNYGYYTYTIQPVDRAGNVGTAVTRTILYDAAAPTVSNINFPVGTTGGANTTFTATIADNLDLRSYTFGFFFGDPNAAHFGALPVESTIIDDTFGAPLTTTHAASITTPYIRGLWSEGVWYPSTHVVFTATDMARNSGVGGFAIPTQTTSPSLRADITTFAIVAPAENATFSNTGTGTTAPTSRTVTARATSNDTQATVPYTRVHFYEVIAGNRRLIGTATTATPIVGPTERTFDYSITYAPGAIPAGTAQIFAVGVQANGDARRTDNVRNVEIQGTL